MKNKSGYEIVDEQIRRIRRLYSEIGRPLDAKIITELYLHLGALIAPPDSEGARDMPRRH